MGNAMIRLFVGVLSMFFLTSNSFSQQSEKEINKKVNELLSKMTLEEKVGQMTQVTIQVVSAVQGTATQQHKLDPEKLEEAIVKYHVGSILNVFDVAHTVDYWHEVITQIQPNPGYRYKENPPGHSGYLRD
jgi:beta-glucosidase